MGSLIINERPKLKSPSMILGFSGWMDGGMVSTGTIRYLENKFKAKKFAEIDPEEFYIFNIPGSMDVAQLFRPYGKIEDGMLKNFHFPKNEFYYWKGEGGNDLIFFTGKEPNLRWRSYANCILELAKEFDVRRMYFIGSVAGQVPHTREPMVSSYANVERLRAELKRYNVSFTNYEGPISITTLLNLLSGKEGIEMTNLVATIPIYVGGHNPKGIYAVTSRLTKLLNMDIDLDDLDKMGKEIEKTISEKIEQDPRLVELVRKFEEVYDAEGVIEGTPAEFVKDIEEFLKRQRGNDLK